MAALTHRLIMKGELMNLRKEIIEGQTWYTVTVGRESFSTQRDTENEAKLRLKEIIIAAGLDPNSAT